MPAHPARKNFCSAIDLTHTEEAPVLRDKINAGMKDAMKAQEKLRACTLTVSPAFTNRPASAGTSATRSSPGLVSRGTATVTLF